LDRLVNENPAQETEAQPFRTLDETGLRRSVQQELEKLLSTRCQRSFSAVYGRPRSILDYGMPEMSIYVLNHEGNATGLNEPGLKALLKETIETFEPRLKNVEVEIKAIRAESGELSMSVSADLVCGAIREPVRFEVDRSTVTGLIHEPG